MDEVCPQLLDLIPKEREWLVKKEVSIDRGRNHGVSEEKKLELRLGPPGVEDWTLQGNKPKMKEQESLISLGHLPNMNQNCWMNGSHSKANGSYLQFQSTTQQSLTVMGKESSQPCCTNPADAADKKAFSPASVNTAVANTSQKRTAPAPVVGWPPIRSFRKNLTNSSSAKQIPEPQSVVPNKAPVEKNVETSRKGLFVKINMDGVPIGRKVDLRAYDSYEKLSTAVDELFRGLLAAQKDSSASGSMNSGQEEKAITGLLDGTGEYTLVYEDNEGDRMLAGDVPWPMFVSTVKRLRVLKSSELSKLCLGSKQEKIELNG